ncbi:hypothetical protein HAV22_02525 [Massilia sp. TW-1]|uniref:Uncharacterized protein n=1 Tax=Telluria antibiotica TaxID=2717319 RepID=A0ABX0P6G1_9BURK|nr:hypothetical protein [Telluria antibiotica]NIA52530.1 hypothetical protein [Telluria antibiotica]
MFAIVAFDRIAWRFEMILVRGVHERVIDAAGLSGAAAARGQDGARERGENEILWSHGYRLLGIGSG